MLEEEEEGKENTPRDNQDIISHQAHTYKMSNGNNMHCFLNLKTKILCTDLMLSKLSDSKKEIQSLKKTIYLHKQHVLELEKRLMSSNMDVKILQSERDKLDDVSIKLAATEQLNRQLSALIEQKNSELATAKHTSPQVQKEEKVVLPSPTMRNFSEKRMVRTAIHLAEMLNQNNMLSLHYQSKLRNWKKTMKFEDTGENKSDSEISEDDKPSRKMQHSTLNVHHSDTASEKNVSDTQFENENEKKKEKISTKYTEKSTNTKIIHTIHAETQTLIQGCDSTITVETSKITSVGIQAQASSHEDEEFCNPYEVNIEDLEKNRRVSSSTKYKLQNKSSKFKRPRSLSPHRDEHSKDIRRHSVHPMLEDKKSAIKLNEGKESGSDSDGNMSWDSVTTVPIILGENLVRKNRMRRNYQIQQMENNMYNQPSIQNMYIPPFRYSQQPHFMQPMYNNGYPYQYFNTYNPIMFNPYENNMNFNYIPNMQNFPQVHTVPYGSVPLIDSDERPSVFVEEPEQHSNKIKTKIPKVTKKPDVSSSTDESVVSEDDRRIQSNKSGHETSSSEYESEDSLSMSYSKRNKKIESDLQFTGNRIDMIESEKEQYSHSTPSKVNYEKIKSNKLNTTHQLKILTIPDSKSVSSQSNNIDTITDYSTVEQKSDEEKVNVNGTQEMNDKIKLPFDKVVEQDCFKITDIPVKINTDFSCQQIENQSTQSKEEETCTASQNTEILFTGENNDEDLTQNSKSNNALIQNLDDDELNSKYPEINDNSLSKIIEFNIEVLKKKQLDCLNTVPYIDVSLFEPEMEKSVDQSDWLHALNVSYERTYNDSLIIVEQQKSTSQIHEIESAVAEKNQNHQIAADTYLAKSPVVNNCVAIQSTIMEQRPVKKSIENHEKLSLTEQLYKTDKNTTVQISRIVSPVKSCTEKQETNQESSNLDPSVVNDCVTTVQSTLVKEKPVKKSKEIHKEKINKQADSSTFTTHKTKIDTSEILEENQNIKKDIIKDIVLSKPCMSAPAACIPKEIITSKNNLKPQGISDNTKEIKEDRPLKKFKSFDPKESCFKVAPTGLLPALMIRNSSYNELKSGTKAKSVQFNPVTQIVKPPTLIKPSISGFVQNNSYSQESKVGTSSGIRGLGRVSRVLSGVPNKPKSNEPSADQCFKVPEIVKADDFIIKQEILEQQNNENASEVSVDFYSLGLDLSSDSSENESNPEGKKLNIEKNAPTIYEITLSDSEDDIQVAHLNVKAKNKCLKADEVQALIAQSPIVREETTQKSEEDTCNKKSNLINKTETSKFTKKEINKNFEEKRNALREKLLIVRKVNKNEIDRKESMATEASLLEIKNKQSVAKVQKRISIPITEVDIDSQEITSELPDTGKLVNVDKSIIRRSKTRQVRYSSSEEFSDHQDDLIHEDTSISNMPQTSCASEEITQDHEKPPPTLLSLALELAKTVNKNLTNSSSNLLTGPENNELSNKILKKKSNSGFEVNALNAEVSNFVNATSEFPLVNMEIEPLEASLNPMLIDLTCDDEMGVSSITPQKSEVRVETSRKRNAYDVADNKITSNPAEELKLNEKKCEVLLNKVIKTESSIPKLDTSNPSSSNISTLKKTILKRNKFLAFHNQPKVSKPSKVAKVITAPKICPSDRVSKPVEGVEGVHHKRETEHVSKEGLRPPKVRLGDRADCPNIEHNLQVQAEAAEEVTSQAVQPEEIEQPNEECSDTVNEIIHQQVIENTSNESIPKQTNKKSVVGKNQLPPVEKSEDLKEAEKSYACLDNEEKNVQQVTNSNIKESTLKRTYKKRVISKNQMPPVEKSKELKEAEKLDVCLDNEGKNLQQVTNSNIKESTPKRTYKKRVVSKNQMPPVEKSEELKEAEKSDVCLDNERKNVQQVTNSNIKESTPKRTYKKRILNKKQISVGKSEELKEAVKSDECSDNEGENIQQVTKSNIKESTPKKTYKKRILNKKQISVEKSEELKEAVKSDEYSDNEGENIQQVTKSNIKESTPKNTYKKKVVNKKQMQPVEKSEEEEAEKPEQECKGKTVQQVLDKTAKVGKVAKTCKEKEEEIITRKSIRLVIKSIDKESGNLVCNNTEKVTESKKNSTRKRVCISPLNGPQIKKKAVGNKSTKKVTEEKPVEDTEFGHFRDSFRAPQPTDFCPSFVDSLFDDQTSDEQNTSAELEKEDNTISKTPIINSKEKQLVQSDLTKENENLVLCVPVAITQINTESASKSSNTEIPNIDDQYSNKEVTTIMSGQKEECQIMELSPVSPDSHISNLEIIQQAIKSKTLAEEEMILEEKDESSNVDETKLSVFTESDDEETKSLYSKSSLPVIDAELSMSNIPSKNMNIISAGSSQSIVCSKLDQIQLKPATRPSRSPWDAVGSSEHSPSTCDNTNSSSNLTKKETITSVTPEHFNSSVVKSMSQNLLHLVCGSKFNLDETTRQIQQSYASVSLAHIAEAILIVVADNSKKEEDLSISGRMVTETQFNVINLIAKLEKTSKFIGIANTIITTVPFCIANCKFEGKQSQFKSAKSLCSLTRVFLSVCRMKQRVQPVRSLIYQAMCDIYSKSSIIIYEALTAWPASVIPNFSDLNTMQKSITELPILSQCLVYVMLSFDPDKDTNGHFKVRRLLQLLNIQYKYEQGVRSSFDLLQHIINRLEGGEVIGVESGLVLLSHCEGATWSKMLIASLQKLLVSYNKSPQAEQAAQVAAKVIASVTNNILLSHPSYVTEVVRKFKLILEKDGVSESLQERVKESLRVLKQEV